MKKTFVLVFAAIFFYACQDSSKDDKKAIDENVVLDEQEVVSELPNKSDIDFMAALDDYEKEDFKAAANHIRDGIDALKIEGNSLNDSLKMQLNSTIEKLTTLADDVEKGEEKGLLLLTQSFANAEMLVAHDYIVYTVVTLVEEPVKGTYYFHKALNSLNEAVLKMEGNAKSEAEEIKKECSDLLAKIKNGAKDITDELNEQTKKVDSFLIKNKTPFFRG